MSLPSVAKDKTSNKISLVTRPSVTLVQPVQVIGTSASQQPTLIYVQSLQPSTQQPPLISANQLNKPKSYSQPISIISSKTIRPPTINKVVSLPSTSIATDRVQTIHFKSPNITSVPSHHQKTTIVSQASGVQRPILHDKQPITTRITKNRPSLLLPSSASASPASTAPIRSTTVVEKLISNSTASNHKAIASNVTKVDPVKYRYRTILENLLQLNNNFIRRTITQAIQKKLCNQSNEDFLNVIFTAFEYILKDVNVEQISLNETYLNATQAFLAKVIETGRFMELIENRKETKDISRFVTSEMSTILNKVSLESVYKNAREIFAQKQRGSYAQILELLIKVVGCVKITPETKMSSIEIEFWLKEVMPLIFDSDDDIQTNAIDAVNKAIPSLLNSRHQSHPYWQQVRNIIVTDYTQKISTCFRQGSPKWHMVWCLCVRLLDVDIPRSASTLNAFLSIVEPALRSNVPIRRAEGYLCWRVLLEVLVRHNRLNSEKRLKLMCTPLKSLQAKTVEIATNKFQAWWYVICNVQENVDNYISMVFEPFLQFCFGQLFSTPNLQLRPADGATQVKSFPDVSLMAIVTFIRMLDESDKQIDELFVRFSLNQPLHIILTETIFSIASTAAIVINACGEATIMLNNLRNDANNNRTCTTLAVCMWTRLFKHVNKAKNIEHINLVLDNVLQLMQIFGHNPNETKMMIPFVCAPVIDHVGTSFIFDPNENGIQATQLNQIIVKFMNACCLFPKIPSQFNVSLSKLLAVPKLNDFEQHFNQFLTEIDEQFFNNDEQQFANKFKIYSKFISCILSCIKINADAFKEHRPNEKSNLPIPSVFYKLLYWPLSIALGKFEFESYTKTLLKTIDLLLTVINKVDFCNESAKMLKNIIGYPSHCVYINDTIATLFDYMVYDFNDLKDAPIEMLDVCVLVIKNYSKIPGLNSIIETLIKYRRAISQKQFEIIAPKMREIVKLIDGDELKTRTEPALMKDLKELIGDDTIVEKSPANKSLRSTKTNRPDDFVVVNKVWKLEPSKLTEHQIEKMKTRRCDIPALYNDLSQSQDSVSIQEWTSKSLAKAVKTEANDEKLTSNDTAQPLSESTASQRTKKGEKGIKLSPKRLNQSQSQIQSENENVKIANEKDTSDEISNSKRRMTRELNRIQIDAKVEEVPYNSLPESRLTRSTIKKIEEDLPSERRKTRSDTTKCNTDPKDVKKKITRASLANSPAPTNKQRSKVNTKLFNSADNEPTGEPTPKRRLTRQSKTEESDHDESIDEKKTDIKKVDNKKTDFVDTLELKVVKLPLEITSKTDEKTENVNEAEREPNLVSSETQNQTEVKIDSTQAPNENKTECAQMYVDDVADKGVDPPEENKENVEEKKESTSEIERPIDTQMDIETEVQPNPEPNTNTNPEIEQDAQVLVETATIPLIPNGGESNRSDELDENTSEKDDTNENDISSRSYMSALHFDGISPSKSLNGSTIVTSPEIDAPRSLEFLNDTINISPIASEAGNVKKDDIASEQVKKKLIDDDLEGIEKLDESLILDKQDVDVKAGKPLANNDGANGKDTDVKKEIEIVNNKNASVAVAAVPESPIVPSKQLKPTLTVQSSTPLQSHQSPVSSKFKTQLMGRGAQLLKMINSNKSSKPASPIPATMSNENVFKTASPTINQLETAPICENVVNTPESKSSRLMDKHEQNENGNILTFSGALPSPYESPGISILKRKSSNISMDDSMHSPAPKRKRVSFGFPLSQTKEYIIDEDFTPYYMIPSNDSPCRRANRLKKLKLKQKQYQTESAKITANDNKPVQSNDTNATTTTTTTTTTITTAAAAASTTNETSTSQTKNDEVSVKHIQEFLGMDMESYKAKQEKQLADENAGGDEPVTNADVHDSNSDDSSTESNDDDPEIEAKPPPIAKTIQEFPDDVIFAHLLSKYSPNDILKKLESSIDAKALTKRLSTLMKNDKQIENTVLEEFAEKHAEPFLEHAITENLCSVICDRLSVKSSNGINDYLADKINADEQFASDFLDRISVTVLRQKIMDIVTTSKREQHILLDDFLTALKDYISRTQRTVDTGILPEHVHLWVSKLFDQFKLTQEQYLQLTSIYIQRNPPSTLDHFD